MISLRLAAPAIACLMAAPSAQADSTALLECDRVADLDQADFEQAKSGIRIGNYTTDDSAETIPITIRFPEDSLTNLEDFKAAVIAYCRKRGD